MLLFAFCCFCFVVVRSGFTFFYWAESKTASVSLTAQHQQQQKQEVRQSHVTLGGFRTSWENKKSLDLFVGTVTAVSLMTVTVVTLVVLIRLQLLFLIFDSHCGQVEINSGSEWIDVGVAWGNFHFLTKSCSRWRRLTKTKWLKRSLSYQTKLLFHKRIWSLSSVRFVFNFPLNCF